MRITINRFSLRASAKLDNIFGRSNNWALYHYELSDLDMVPLNSAGQYSREHRQLL